MATISKTNRLEERDLLLAMMTSEKVATKVAQVWEPNLFQSKHSNLLAEWAVEYVKKYNTPIGADIEKRVRQYIKENRKDEATIDLLEDILEQLQERFADDVPINDDFVIERAEKLFTEYKLETLNDQIDIALSQNDTPRALEEITKFRQPSMTANQGIFPLDNIESTFGDVFKNRDKSLITLDNDLQSFLCPELVPGAFVGFLGADKSGKSFWLMEVLFWALQQKIPVAVFQIGDMSEKQYLWRIARRMKKKPMEQRYCQAPMEIPTKLVEEGGKITPLYVEKQYTSPLQLSDLIAMQGLVKPNMFYLETQPAGSITVQDIKMRLEQQRLYHGFTPQIVIVDYADLLKPTRTGDNRDMIDSIWKGLRGLSLETNTCLVTASHTNRTGYTADILTPDTIGEDRRKLAHVTAMIGLNRTKEERKAGMQRLNMVMSRDSGFPVNYCCYVSQHFPTGRICIDTKMAYF